MRQINVKDSYTKRLNRSEIEMATNDKQPSYNKGGHLSR
jgi:hypothetical protein